LTIAIPAYGRQIVIVCSAIWSIGREAASRRPSALADIIYLFIYLSGTQHLWESVSSWLKDEQAYIDILTPPFVRA